MAGKITKTLSLLLALGLAGGATFLVITRPQGKAPAFWADTKSPDLANGELVFSQGGCVSCHAAPGAEGDQKLVLSGGLAFKTAFGTFHAPNISPDKAAGIGDWTLQQFGDALVAGVGRNGEHLYPSLPYGSYARMSAQDVADLYGYMQSLPASAVASKPHDLSFPFNIRLSLGGWKFLYLNDRPRVTLANLDDTLKRGQYLVEGPGHCGECHTPRDAFGGFVKDQWLAGAPNPDGPGQVPNITPGSKTMGSWSEGDIVAYLETGFTPEFDSVGGAMVEVQKNMAKLPASDRAAIAAYLKAIPAR